MSVRNARLAAAAATAVVGLAASAHAQFQVRTFDAPTSSTTPLTNFGEADTLFGSPPNGSIVETSTVDLLDLFQNGGNGQSVINNPFGPSFPVGGDQDDFTSRATGTLVVPTAGSFDFFTDTDDGGRLRIDLNMNGTFDGGAEDVVVADALQGAGDPEFFSEANGGALLDLAAGNYNFEFSFFERAGGASGEAGFATVAGGFPIVFGDTSGAGINTSGPITVRTVGQAADPLSGLNNINEAEQLIARNNPDATLESDTVNFGGADRPAFPGAGGDQFALEASGRVDVVDGTTGTFDLFVDSDDGFRLTRNGEVIGEFVDPTGSSNTTIPGVTLNDGDVLRLTFFEAGGGEFVTFRVGGAGGPLVGDPASGIDIVPIPEPATFGLLALGGLGLLARRRR